MPGPQLFATHNYRPLAVIIHSHGLGYNFLATYSQLVIVVSPLQRLVAWTESCEPRVYRLFAYGSETIFLKLNVSKTEMLAISSR